MMFFVDTAVQLLSNSLPDLKVWRLRTCNVYATSISDQNTVCVYVQELSTVVSSMM